MSPRVSALLLCLAITFGNVVGISSTASAQTPASWFPVQVDDNVAWSDTYGAPRSGGRTHKGVDIMAPQMQPVYASMGGYIRRAYGGDDRSCLDGGYCTSYGFLIYGDDGRSYFYLHLNDDTPGRPNGCDHIGGAENGFSPRLNQVLRERGSLQPLPNAWDTGDVVRVETGELIGYVGSSGNAGCNVNHLHYETWAGHDFRSANDPAKDNPYPIVQADYEAGRFWDEYGAIEPVETARLAGPNRVVTSIAISQAGFEQAPVAVIAPAEVYPEALVGAPLAAAMQSPVLLHWGTADPEAPFTVDPAVVDEMTRLGVEDVVVLSAGDTMDPRFEDALAEASGLDRERIVRLAANDRYELSAKVAEKLLAMHGWAPPTDTEASSQDDPIAGLLGGLNEPSDASDEEPAPVELEPILALGEHEIDDRGWPDALAAATLAAAQRTPILLTRPQDLPEATAALLDREGIGSIRIVGGTGAISEDVETAVNEAGHETRRLAGTNRYQTALAITQELIELGHQITDLHIATGDNFPDAMAAGASIAADGGVLLLVDGEVAQGAPTVLQWVRENEASIAKVTALGGPKAVNARVLRTVAIHANWPLDDAASEDDAGT